VSVLVVSGQLPPRGLVTGTVYDGGSSKSVPSLTLSFQEANGPRIYSAVTDAQGHFSVTFPPGKYRVKTPPYYAVIYQRLFALSHDSAQTATPDLIIVTAGSHVKIDYSIAKPIAICLAADDRIATPAGSVPIVELRPGMMVWTLDAAGRRVAAPVLLVSHTPAPPGHHVLRLLLSDGRVVEASGGHPLADGRRVAELESGDLLDGSRLSSVEPILYVGDTWDLLPAGPSGVYWANGVLLGSTLRSWPLK
jgi:hypothetical protein